MTAPSSGPIARAGISGSLRFTDDIGTVRVQGCLDAGIEDVWSAVTDPHRLACWLGKIEGDLRLGGSFRARFVASEWEGVGSIDVCESPRHLLVSTTGTGDAEHHAMEVTLTAQGAQTVLVVEERGMPRKQLAAYGAGMQIHVEDLVAYLGGGDRCDAKARWDELFPVYASKSIDPAE